MHINQSVRVIVKLDVKPPYVVKPILFEGLRKMGLSTELAQKYYKQGADEIMYVDIVASLYRREILYDNIQKTADELFVPFGVGGGVKTVEDFSKLFHMGADKVIINTYAIHENPDIINEAARIFGNQAVVVNIEAKRWQNCWKCHTDGGKIESDKDVVKWAMEVEQRGAGEILLQSIDCDGLEKGFDLELSKKVVNSVNIPVVISSGAGSLEDIKELIEYVNPSGVAIASLLHYNKFTVDEIKNYLNNNDMKIVR